MLKISLMHYSTGWAALNVFCVLLKINLLLFFRKQAHSCQTVHEFVEAYNNSTTVKCFILIALNSHVKSLQLISIIDVLRSARFINFIKVRSCGHVWNFRPSHCQTLIHSLRVFDEHRLLLLLDSWRIKRRGAGLRNTLANRCACGRRSDLSERPHGFVT